MANVFWKTGFLVLIIGSTAYFGFIEEITKVITGFNTYVVPMIPSELKFIILIIAFGLLYKIRQAFH